MAKPVAVDLARRDQAGRPLPRRRLGCDRQAVQPPRDHANSRSREGARAPHGAEHIVLVFVMPRRADKSHSPATGKLGRRANRSKPRLLHLARASGRRHGPQGYGAHVAPRQPRMGSLRVLLFYVQRQFGHAQITTTERSSMPGSTRPARDPPLPRPNNSTNVPEDLRSQLKNGSGALEILVSGSDAGMTATASHANSTPLPRRAPEEHTSTPGRVVSTPPLAVGVSRAQPGSLEPVRAHPQSGTPTEALEDVAGHRRDGIVPAAPSRLPTHEIEPTEKTAPPPGRSSRARSARAKGGVPTGGFTK